MFESSIPEPAPHLVQNGWRVASRDGAELGYVIDAEDDDLVIRNGCDEGDLRIPKRYIAEEADGEMRASLVLDEAEARSLYDAVGSPVA